MKRTRLFACLLGVVGLVGCRAETGTTLQIRDTPAFEDDCTINAVPTEFQGQGIFDPAGASNYIMPLLIVNNTNDTENPAAIPGDTNIKPSANDAQIIGFDYCVYDAQAEGVTAYDPKGKGDLVDCDDVPDSQRAFLPSGGGVSSGGGTLVAAFSTLNTVTLRSLFGETFTPSAIPPGDDPTSNTRSAAWGNFPQAFSSVVTVQLRIRAKDQAGRTVRSNWYAFPVLVAPTVIRDACSAAILPCTGGGSALQGTQFPPDTCSAIYSGASFVCEAVNLCP